MIAVRGESAEIVVDPERACQACARGQGCGMSVFSRWLGSRSVRLSVQGNADWRAGQSVSLKIAPALLLKMAAWAYGLPLLGFLLGAGLATRFFQGLTDAAGIDMLALLCGLGGMLAGALAVRVRAAPVALSVAADRDVLIE